MIFSSTLFIFLFLPIVLGIHFIIDRKYRNLFLLVASLFFYAWGEHILVLLMMSSICVNYVIGNIISEFQKQRKDYLSKTALALGIIFNLLVLGYYKYIHFFVDSFASIGININTDFSHVTLPIGISFFTFQSISYLMDVYRKVVTGQKSLVKLGMYISLFPQLIAGPIVRYADIAKEIESRTISISLFKDGVYRFIIGFVKKVLIANNVGLIADKVFEIAPGELSSSLSWIGVLCYSLQIYYDFSGYSDMAIGLGKMFGFNFKENFEHPYISRSIQEFWRRWHISLSSWFRDYLYIPLGGNRKGLIRTYLNLVIVFFVTGLWHGASWNFVIWGLFHGAFLIVERLNFIKLPSKLKFLSHIYTLLVVMIGWVLFRAENLGSAMVFISKMFSFKAGSNNFPYLYLNRYVFTIILLGIVFSMPVRNLIENKLNQLVRNKDLVDILKFGFSLLLFVLSLMELAQTTYNPFIYYRF